MAPAAAKDSNPNNPASASTPAVSGSVSGELALARIVPMSQTARQLVTIVPSRTVLSDDAEPDAEPDDDDDVEEPTIDGAPLRRFAVAQPRAERAGKRSARHGTRGDRRSEDLGQPLNRHGRAWPDHPRVSWSKAAPMPANSWILVPSTRMTNERT